MATVITGSGRSDETMRRLGAGNLVVTSRRFLPEEIRTWLGDLLRLRRVPFPYLVPDERLLPPESLRCFFIDDDWVRAAVDGALAAATPTAVERSALLEQYATILDHLGLGAPGQEAGHSPPALRTGFLLRSRLLTRWPGVRIGGAQVVHRELLTPSILLVVFDGRPSWFSLIEPGGETTLAVQRRGTDVTLLRSDLSGNPPVVPPRAGAAPGVLDWRLAGVGNAARLAANVLDGLTAVRFEGTAGAVPGDVFHPTAGGQEPS